MLRTQIYMYNKRRVIVIIINYQVSWTDRIYCLMNVVSDDLSMLIITTGFNVDVVLNNYGTIQNIK